MAPDAPDIAKRASDCTSQELKLAQPLEPSEVTFEAWYMDEDTETDQREPHRQQPNKPCPPETLKEIGVLAWKLDPTNWEDDVKLKAIRKARGYDYHDVVNVAEGKLPEYEKKIQIFYEEHMHTDEEIRYVLGGSGYFDVRGKDDKWIRIAMGPGDMIVLPEGIYHRYTNDTTNYVQAMRLFAGEPVWTAHNRPQEDNASRQKYVKTFITPAVAAN
mmetsp:Transcript_16170/g.45056  ORF Transcript_16170/g.45056 Transcript_16170/m.45056 type:complete len:216 (-) Transcript_16170:97-744(-)